MCLRTPKLTKISWGSLPPDPPTMKDCRAAMFSTSAYDINPLDGKVMYGLVNEVCCIVVARSLQHHHLVIEYLVTSVLL